MKHQIKIFKNILLTALLAVGMGFSASAQSSCVVNGVTISVSGPSVSASGIPTNNMGCPSQRPASGSGAWTGAGMNTILTYTFSQPVTSATVGYTVINGNDKGLITTNAIGGTLSLSNICGAVLIAPNQLDGTPYGTLWGDVIVTVTNTTPFTSVKVTNATGNSGWVQGNLCNFTLTLPCVAGTTAPVLSGTSISNICPTTTVNLNSLVTSSTPANSSLVWFTNNAHTGTAYATPTTAAAGTYYAFYYDAAGSCYTPASGAVTSTVTACSVVGAGTIDCSKTSLSPAPVSGVPTASGDKIFMKITVNVTTAGCIPVSIAAGSGFSVADGFTQICPTTTGVQEFMVPVTYSGTPAFSSSTPLTFTVGANQCTADLTKAAKPTIINTWSLECLPTVGPGLQ